MERVKFSCCMISIASSPLFSFESKITQLVNAEIREKNNVKMKSQWYRKNNSSSKIEIKTPLKIHSLFSFFFPFVGFY